MDGGGGRAVLDREERGVCNVRLNTEYIAGGARRACVGPSPPLLSSKRDVWFGLPHGVHVWAPGSNGMKWHSSLFGWVVGVEDLWCVLGVDDWAAVAVAAAVVPLWKLAGRRFMYTNGQGKGIPLPFQNKPLGQPVIEFQEARCTPPNAGDIPSTPKHIYTYM
ncbi:hypothetical protein EYC84_009177 [Monilinia fructicola]|uniref:Uncharacterized protein n=1 Tax=Monilinia fructicola TaxID=38448 RepID=A0A5M9JFZ3_MONFR|nr:hypothetical protein EYC84_009177 [Monilinia fructicola]